MISCLVCVDKNWAIGKVNKETGKGELLFKLKKDLEWFKKMTLHKVVVMGYQTYLSLPEKNRPLPDRVNVVLWDKATSMDCLDGCITFNSFEPLLKFVQILSKSIDVVISGGSSIYNLFLPYYDVIYVTKVDAEDPDATAFFPNLDKMSEFRHFSFGGVETDDEYKTRKYYYGRKEQDGRI